jgi:5-methylcytosine-specific restriction endonuclease McrA
VTSKFAKIIDLCDIFFKIAADKEYMRSYMKERYHRVRNNVIDRLGGKCIVCHSGKNLHLDHIDKKKKTLRMADIHSVSDEKLEKEIQNIQILCEDCHKKKTRDAWDYGTNKPRHGTYWYYRKYGCRCRKCIDAYKLKHKEWNEARKK